MYRKQLESAEKLVEFHDLNVADLAYALRYLSYFGHLDGEPTRDAVEMATRGFQEMAGVDVDGWIGRQTLKAMTLPRCGCRDNALTEAVKWRKRELSYYIESYLTGLSGLSTVDQDDLLAACLRMYEQTIDVKWRRATSRTLADLVISVGRGAADQFDGPSGVLAWCELPPGNDRQIRLKFDATEAWIKSTSSGQRGILYQNVAAHELGHGHGMQHITGPTALLNPFYNQNVGTLQSADVQSLLSLGYAKATTPPPSDPPTPPVSPGREIISLVVEGKIVDIGIPGFGKVS